MNDLQNLPALNACPFCGHAAQFNYSYPPYSAELAERYGDPEKIGTLHAGCWVECAGEDCSAELGRGGWDSQENDCGNFDTFAEAATAWNTRVPPKDGKAE